MSALGIKALVGLALVIAICVAFGLYNAHEQALGAAQFKVEAAQAQEAEHERMAKINFRNDEIAGNLATTKADREVQYATITKTVDRVVDRPVYHNVCLDPDGLRSINAALAGKADDPGIPASAVPATAAP